LVDFQNLADSISSCLRLQRKWDISHLHQLKSCKTNREGNKLGLLSCL